MTKTVSDLDSTGIPYTLECHPFTGIFNLKGNIVPDIADQLTIATVSSSVARIIMVSYGVSQLRNGQVSVGSKY